jgi:hypothetical protein
MSTIRHSAIRAQISAWTNTWRDTRRSQRGGQASRLAFLGALVAVMSLTLALAGCNLTTGASNEQPLALPTVTAPPISSAAPSHDGLTITGDGAIKPHLSSVPSFTADDMKQYVASHPILAPDLGAGQPSVTQAGFLSCTQIDSQVGSRVSDLLRDCGKGAIYGFVLESGAFAFPGADGGPHSSAQRAFALFDASSGNLVLDGSASSPTAPTPTPTGTVPPTPVPHVAFAMKPTSAEQTCQSSFTVLPAITVTLDNTGSNVSVDWKVSISETIGKSGVVWASAAPTSGSVAAGQTAQLVITPASAICSLSQSVAPDATYHVVIGYGAGQQLTFSDLVHSPIPG